jgi:hypothetical protein
MAIAELSIEGYRSMGLLSVKADSETGVVGQRTIKADE